MSKKALIILLIFCALPIFSQKETCNTSEDDNLSLDLNTITKCVVKVTKPENSSNNRSVAIVVSTRRRVIRKRNKKNSISNNNYAHKLKEIRKTRNIVKKLDLTNNAKTVSFDVVDEIPLFKNCENSLAIEQEKCFKNELLNYVQDNLKYPEFAYKNAIQGEVFVNFIIKKDGSIDEIKTTAPHQGEILADEVERIMKKLPKLMPGKHNGNTIVVKYGFPISFKIPEVKNSSIKKGNNKGNSNGVYTFSQIETIPQFSSCSKANNTSLKCYNSKLTEHIQNNFVYPEVAVDDNIEGIVDITFVINKKGEVVNIETNNSEDLKVLEEAAKVLIEKLPKFKAGTKEGNAVNVKYSFPVVFKL